MIWLILLILLFFKMLFNGVTHRTFTFQSKLSNIKLQLGLIFRIGIRTRIIVIYFVKPKLKVFHKSKESLNTSFYICYRIEM
jgi:hypothetical protein